MGWTPSANPMGIFAGEEPPAFLNISDIQLAFECGGDSSYDSICPSGSVGGAVTATFTNTASHCTDPDNSATLDGLTCQFSDDWISWFVMQFDFTLAGISNIAPNGYIDEIEIEYTSETAATRFRSCPLNGWPTNLSHDDRESCPDPAVMVDGQLYPGVVTETITAGSPTSYGSGKVQLRMIDSTVPDESDWGAPRKVYNRNNAKIDVGKSVWIAKVLCLLFLITADC
jgi:hypothetical protein